MSQSKESKTTSSPAKPPRAKAQDEVYVSPKVLYSAALETNGEIPQIGIGGDYICIKFKNKEAAEVFKSEQKIVKKDRIIDEQEFESSTLEADLYYVFFNKEAAGDLDNHIAKAENREKMLESLLGMHVKQKSTDQMKAEEIHTQAAIKLINDGTALNENARKHLALQEVGEISMQCFYETCLARIEHIEELKKQSKSADKDRQAEIEKEIKKVRNIMSDEISKISELDSLAAHLPDKPQDRLKQAALYQDKDGNTLAHICAANGEENLRNLLLNEVPGAREAKNEKGKTPGDIRIQKVKESSAQKIQDLAEEAFKLAEDGKDTELKKFLQSKHWKIGESLNKDGNNIMHLAAKSGLEESTKFLLKKRPKLALEKNKEGRKPSELDGGKKISKVFSQHQANLDANLVESIKESRRNDALDCLDKGANPLQLLEKKQNLLHIAAQNALAGDKEVIDALIKKGVDINALDADGKSPAHLAANSHGNERQASSAMELLAQSGADLLQPDRNGLMPIDILEYAHGKEAVKRLVKGTSEKLHDAPDIYSAMKEISQGADVNFVDSQGKTSLMNAIENNQYDVARELISRGADITATTTDGRNILHFASEKGWEAMEAITTSRGWESLGETTQTELVNAKGGDEKRTPLHLAHDQFTIGSLRLKGADIEAKDSRGNSPIDTLDEKLKHQILKTAWGMPGSKSVEFTGDSAQNDKLLQAIEQGNAANLVKAITDGASIQTKKDDKSLIHLALEADLTEEKREAVIRNLVEYGADVNEKNKYGQTPLMVAATQGKAEIVRELLNAPDIEVRASSMHKAEIKESSKEKSELMQHRRTALGMARAELAKYGKYSEKRKSKYKALEAKKSQGFTKANAKRVKKISEIEGEIPKLHARLGALEEIVRTLEVRDNEAKLEYLARKGRAESSAREKTGKRTTIRQMLANDNKPYMNIGPAILAATKNGNSKSLDLLLQRYSERENHPSLDQIKNEKGQNLFDIAYENGDKSSMKLLAAAKQSLGEKPLVSRERIKEALASSTKIGPFSRDSSLAKSIIKRAGSKIPNSINYPDPKNGNSLLHDAIEIGDKKAVKELLKLETINLNAQNHDGKTVLHLAAEKGDKELVRNIMQRARAKELKIDIKSFVEKGDKFGRSAIHFAAASDKAGVGEKEAEKGSKEIFQILLENSHADPAKADLLGRRPIDYANDSGHTRAELGLYEYGSPSINGVTKIEAALMADEQGRIERLFRKSDQITDATKLFEKFYPKAKHDGMYSKDGPKFMAMAAKNGRHNLLKRLAQDPYLSMENGQLLNKADLMEAAIILGKTGDEESIAALRNAIVNDEVTIIPGKMRDSLLAEFDEKITLAERLAEVERRIDQIDHDRSIARMLEAQDVREVLHSRARAGRTMQASSVARTSSSQRAATFRAPKPEARFNPGKPAETDERKFSDYERDKFLQFIEDGKTDMARRSPELKKKIKEESTELVSSLISSGKVRNCGDIDENERTRKVFNVKLEENKSRSVFFPKFDSKGNQILSDSGKPVVDVIVVSSEGKIIAGTLTDPIDESSMPQKYIDQVNAINAPSQTKEITSPDKSAEATMEITPPGEGEVETKRTFMRASTPPISKSAKIAANLSGKTPTPLETIPEEPGENLSSTIDIAKKVKSFTYHPTQLEKALEIRKKEIEAIPGVVSENKEPEAQEKQLEPKKKVTFSDQTTVIPDKTLEAATEAPKAEPTTPETKPETKKTETEGPGGDEGAGSPDPKKEKLLARTVSRHKWEGRKADEIAAAEEAKLNKEGLKALEARRKKNEAAQTQEATAGDAERPKEKINVTAKAARLQALLSGEDADKTEEMKNALSQPPSKTPQKKVQGQSLN